MSPIEMRETLKAACHLWGLDSFACAYEMHPKYLQWVIDGLIPAGPRLVRLLEARCEPAYTVV